MIRSERSEVVRICAALRIADDRSPRRADAEVASIAASRRARSLDGSAIGVAVPSAPITSAASDSGDRCSMIERACARARS